VSYTVLARRYRSQDFDEVVGQEPIARTLQNAIRTGRTAHAYLFTGTRGVGKTSMARIFARALNVTDELTQKKEIAAAIARGDDLDVIEIDGASNRGVNEARDLIAAAGLSPARCPYKIYIIDEVHMLTREAFNTLLKTMEEPPSHVKFILCTTEPHKVPATIQSRCQRFDFRPIATPLIAAHLGAILKTEGIKADAEVVMQVARLGHGSMRDALSLLDRLLAAAVDGTLTSDILEQMLGLPDQALVRSLVEAIAAGDPRKALDVGGQLLATGASVEQALDLLTDVLRDLMIIVTCGDDSVLVDQSAESRAALAAITPAFDAAGLVHLIALCEATGRHAQGSATSRALFDAALVRMAMSEHLADIAALLSGAPPAAPRARISAPAASVEARAPAKKKEVSPPESAPPDEPLGAPPRCAASTVTEIKPAETPASAVIADDALWDAVLKAAGQSPMMQTIIDDLEFRAIEGGVIELALNEHGRQRARYMLTQKDKLEAFIARVAGRKLRVTIEVGAETPAPRAKVGAEALEEAQKLPAVSRAIELFDATVIDVQDDEPGEPEGGRDV